MVLSDLEPISEKRVIRGQAGRELATPHPPPHWEVNPEQNNLGGKALPRSPEVSFRDGNTQASSFRHAILYPTLQGRVWKPKDSHWSLA